MSEGWLPCGLCGEPAYDVAVHPCCRFWIVDQGERTCIACAESRKAARRRR